MSTDDKNRRLADLCDQKAAPLEGCPDRWTHVPFPDRSHAHQWHLKPPNYCSSLDAVHSVVKSLTEPQRQLYREHLCRQRHIYLALDADAETRVDALISTLENL